VTASSTHAACDQVYVLGCASAHVFHVRVDGSGSHTSTNSYSTHQSNVGGDDTGDMFLIETFESLVVTGRESSDEVRIGTHD